MPIRCRANPLYLVQSLQNQVSERMDRALPGFPEGVQLAFDRADVRVREAVVVLPVLRAKKRIRGHKTWDSALAAVLYIGSRVYGLPCGTPSTSTFDLLEPHPSVAYSTSSPLPQQAYPQQAYLR